MRSLKPTGGLTRGTAFEKVQRNIYILSRQACTEISTSIELLTGTKYISSHRQKSPINSRLEHDNIDIDKLTFSKEYNLFPNEKNLTNIVTGAVANEKVNAYEAGEIG